MRRILRPRVLFLAAVIAVWPAALALASTQPSRDGTPLATAPAPGPDTTIDSGPSGPTDSASPTFTFSSPLGPTSFSCRLDEAPFEPCASPQAFADLLDGPHTFYVHAGDGDGNGDRTPASTSFVVDTGAPNATVDSGPDGPTNDPHPAFEFSSPDDTVTFACSIDTGTPSFAPCSGAATDQPVADLADGSYTFRVQATDPAGNSTTATREFTVDTEAPALTVDSGPAGSTADPRPAFGFSSPDDSVTFACSIDPGTPSFAPCSGADTDEPAADLAAGSYIFSVQATDSAGNSTTATRDFELAAAEPKAKTMAAYKSSAPSPVPAWYMTARGPGDLKRQARNDACAFAKRQPNRTRLLLMDFGKSEKHRGHWGTQLRTGPHFTNQHILDALKAAAHIYRGRGPCYTRGSVRMTYGNTNNLPEWMSNRAVREAGRRQARMANRLQKYQRRQGLHFQGVAVAGDIEPQWNPPRRTKDMVQGATAHKRGGLYFNYGAASECPPEGKACANRWDVKDLATVSYGGVRRALPEIYRRVHAKQWTRVRKYWNRNHNRRFCFYGATSTPGFPVKMRESWARLRAKNRCVKRELVNIREQ